VTAPLFPSAVSLLDMVIDLVAEVDRVRHQALVVAHNLEPYAELHPYLGSQIADLRSVALPSSGSGGRGDGSATSPESDGFDAWAAAPTTVSHSAVPTGNRTNNQPARSRADGSSSTKGGRSEVTGTDTEPRSGRWTCRCGHTTVAHSEWGPCRMTGCLCDRFFAPRKNDAATPGRVAASSPSNP
jgi:hypothetical protein